MHALNGRKRAQSHEQLLEGIYLAQQISPFDGYSNLYNTQEEKGPWNAL